MHVPLPKMSQLDSPMYFTDKWYLGHTLWPLLKDATVLSCFPEEPLLSSLHSFILVTLRWWESCFPEISYLTFFWVLLSSCLSPPQCKLQLPSTISALLHPWPSSWLLLFWNTRPFVHLAALKETRFFYFLFWIMGCRDVCLVPMVSYFTSSRCGFYFILTF